ncbi:MAG: hypothetical protein EOP56_14625 [Sphingobacteriales bacterium]|nr:MAG: hypothetical protein EOP56_14625 [Sphingobacteriales bacterium]
MMLLGACQKNNNIPAQPDKVTVDVIAPSEGQQYKKGDTVRIKANVSYISQLHGYQVKIIDAESGIAVYDIDGHVHGTNVSIEEYWVDTLSIVKALKVQILAVIDHDKSTSLKEIVVHSQP